MSVVSRADPFSSRRTLIEVDGSGSSAPGPRLRGNDMTSKKPPPDVDDIAEVDLTNAVPSPFSERYKRGVRVRIVSDAKDARRSPSQKTATPGTATRAAPSAPGRTVASKAAGHSGSGRAGESLD